MKKLFTLLAVVAVTAMVTASGALAADAPAADAAAPAAPAAAPAADAAAPAPAFVKIEGGLNEFNLKTADGKDFNNATIAGKKVMFIIAQTACGQCRKEISEVGDEYDEIKKKGDVYTVLVDVNQDRALSYYKKKGYKVPVVLDPNFKIAASADLGVTPATIIVGKDGVISYTKTGYRPGQLETILENF